MEDVESIGENEQIRNFYIKELEPYVIELAKFNGDNWLKFQKNLLKKHNIKRIPKRLKVSYIYRVLVQQNKIQQNKLFEEQIFSNKIPNVSGVLTVTIMINPNKFSCKFKCTYCSKEIKQNKKCIYDEKIFIRASNYNFDVVRQFQDMAKVLYYMEHKLDKLEVVVVGGILSCDDKKYQKEFMRDIYYASNTVYDSIEGIELRKKETLQNEQYLNEVAHCRIINIMLEICPDMITVDKIKKIRNFGCTHVQLEIQHINNEILNTINCSYNYDKIVKSIKLLKDNGFKIDIHLILNLPNSNPNEDIKMFCSIINCQELQVDQWKIYPYEIIKDTQMYDMFKNGKYNPYPKNELKNIIKYILTNVPSYIRVHHITKNILICDNTLDIENISLHDIVQKEMDKKGIRNKDIRCREVKTKFFNENDIELNILHYTASTGIEYFISYESKDNLILYSFLRMRINNMENECIFSELRGCVIIRELHVYGYPIDYNQKDSQSIKQYELGIRLIKKAEEITLELGYRRLAIIACVGLYQYYSQKLGFEKSSYGYMIKELT